MAMTQLLVLVLAAEGMANEVDIDYDVIDAAINTLSIILMGWLGGLLCAIREVDGLPFDIPLEKEAEPIQFTHTKGLRIDDLSNKATPLKMMHFNWSQLHRLYAAFNLDSLSLLSTKLAIPISHIFNGSVCCYQIHPEEVFLFMIHRVATGMTNVQIVNTYFGGNNN